MSGGLPAGYVHVTAGGCRVVTLREHEADARAMLADGALHAAAARDLGARELAGRGIAYAIALPVTRTAAVVRHNRHGGLLAPLTRDLFLPPTRAPYELATSLRLAAAGVRTPAVLMYGVETVAVVFRRADVMTRAVEEARDLATYMLPGEPPAARAAAWRATRELVSALNAAGARHHDLNVKNVLLAPDAGALRAWALDVDRVAFTSPQDAAAGNSARLLRSARKWRAQRGAEFDEDRDLGTG
jgi:hypothetical protein